MSEKDVAHGMLDPVAAIEAEFAANGTADDQYCLDYVLRRKAGSSDRVWPNGTMDAGRHGESFDDFLAHSHSRMAGLDAGHVLALRLYTTAAYMSLNVPLRDPSRAGPHPFPCTILKLSDAIKKLRAVEALSSTEGGVEGAGYASVDLFRGMRDMVIAADFERMGGASWRA